MNFMNLFNTKSFNLKTAITIVFILLILYICYIEVRLNQAQIDLDKKNQEISTLKKDLEHTEILLQVKTELAESYMRITEEQVLHLKETKESFKTYKDSLHNALNINPSWSDSQLPPEVKNALNTPPLVKPIEKEKQ